MECSTTLPCRRPKEGQRGEIDIASAAPAEAMGWRIQEKRRRDNTQSFRCSNAVRERAGTLASAGKFWY